MKQLPIFMLLLLSIFHPARALETRVWAHQPIPITLPIGKGRTLTWPAPLDTVHCLRACSAEAVQWTQATNTLTLLAKKPFPELPLAVTLTAGQVVQLILQAHQADSTADPVQITWPRPKKKRCHHFFDIPYDCRWV